MDQAMFAEVLAHDAALVRAGLEIWIGAEPTFTNPRSQHPCWLSEALGSEKEAHARALLHALAPSLAGSVQLLKVEGRQYPGESAPRWCYGALFDRRGPANASRPYSADMEGDLSATPIPTETQAWLTVTPDPAVVEINMAPAHDLATFARWSEAVYAAAAEAGLAPLRFRYNGDVTDSGGGGQITLGGPTPARSPFLLRPQLLPGMVRYFNRHPSLSYLFAPAVCGSASQGPRPDETVGERFEELPVALDYLAARGDAATPAEIWGMLAPLLVDASGCSHRAELNVEKLWNPWFSGRGQLGLVELRALRMPASPARLTALAALFRAVAARLAKAPYLEPIVHWGSQLHDRFGLPWYLERDLEGVLTDLHAHGLGLGPKLRAELLARPEPLLTLKLEAASLEIRPALSFWPLVGDVAAQGASGSRLVDSSSQRLQVIARAQRGVALGRVAANGWRMPLSALPDEAGQQRAIGSVLYRSFVPMPGLHPAIGAHDPLTIEWQRQSGCARAQLYSWRPGGGAYSGLPHDQAEAERRRSERALVSSGQPGEIRPSLASGSMLDLRRQY